MRSDESPAVSSCANWLVVVNVASP